MFYHGNSKEERLVCVLSHNDTEDKSNPIALVPHSEFIQFELLKTRLEQYYNNPESEIEFSMDDFVARCMEFEPVAKRFCKEFNCPFPDAIENESVKFIWIYINGLDDCQGFLESTLSYWLVDYGQTENLKTCLEKNKNRIVDTVFFLICPKLLPEQELVVLRNESNRYNVLVK
jgi:hypothetical protein